MEDNVSRLTRLYPTGHYRRQIDPPHQTPLELFGNFYESIFNKEADKEENDDASLGSSSDGSSYQVNIKQENLLKESQSTLDEDKLNVQSNEDKIMDDPAYFESRKGPFWKDFIQSHITRKKYYSEPDDAYNPWYFGEIQSSKKPAEIKAPQQKIKIPESYEYEPIYFGYDPTKVNRSQQSAYDCESISSDLGFIVCTTTSGIIAATTLVGAAVSLTGARIINGISNRFLTPQPSKIKNLRREEAKSETPPTVPIPKIMKISNNYQSKYSPPLPVV